MTTSLISRTGFRKTLSSEPIFCAKYDENKRLYLVLNYDKFSQDSPNLITNLVNQQLISLFSVEGL
ncbi:MAG: hypothetical protein WAZ77_16545 [Candidatus Nitrosopolaris sp.]